MHSNNQVYKKMRDIRGALHQHPELAFQKEKTSLLIQCELTRLGIDFKDGLAGNGIRAELEINLQTLLSRRINPAHAAVVAIGKFTAGTVHNVIAEKDNA